MSEQTVQVPASEPAIAAHGLHRRFGAVHALNNATFDVPAGSICGLIGPNGAGKTTLLRILAGLDEPDSGTRSIDGVDLAVDPRGARNRFGYVPDYAGLYDALTVREMVRFFGAAQGVPEAQLDDAVNAALDKSGLQPVGDRQAAALSKGMSQRACVACALVHDPQVLFLDEPASGLDPRARIELRELLKALSRSGKTILISSHILSELGDMVDRVIIMERGVVKAAGPVDVALGNAAAGTGARLRLEVHGDVAAALAVVQGLEMVAKVERVQDVLEVVLKPAASGVVDAAHNAEFIKACVLGGVALSAAVPIRANLETLFMTVTKGELQ